MNKFLLLFSVCVVLLSGVAQSNDLQGLPDGFRDKVMLNPLQQERGGGELRAFWVDSWNYGLFNVSQVKEMVGIAAKYGYNSIFIQVRRRGDALYFPTFPNTEPRIKNIAHDFDPLRSVLHYAHRAGIEVHAWITTFLISTSKLSSSPQHVVNRHPEYLMQDSSGNKKIAEGYYLDPGNPGALAWNTRVVMDLVQHYQLDGLHFDYVRYPQQDAGYNPTAIARYNAEYHLTGKPRSNDARFCSWRRRQITDWLRKTYVKIIECKPDLKVSAATFAGRSDAYNCRFQDWAEWMREGIIDANCPMNYSRSLSLYKTRVDDILQHRYSRHVYMGSGAYLLKIDDLIQQFLYARSRLSNGLIVYSYRSNGQGQGWLENFQKLRTKVFSPTVVLPIMPWKNNPAIGYFRGQVVSQQQGKFIYNAHISIPALKQDCYSDARGEFAFTNLKPGIYDIVCQAQGFESSKIRLCIVGKTVAVHHFELK